METNAACCVEIRGIIRLGESEMCNVCVYFLKGKGKESQDGCMRREVWERVSKYWGNAELWIRFYCISFVGLVKNGIEGREESRWV